MVGDYVEVWLEVEFETRCGGAGAGVRVERGCGGHAAGRRSGGACGRVAGRIGRCGYIVVRHGVVVVVVVQQGARRAKKRFRVIRNQEQPIQSLFPRNIPTLTLLRVPQGPSPHDPKQHIDRKFHEEHCKLENKKNKSPEHDAAPERGHGVKGETCCATVGSAGGVISLRGRRLTYSIFSATAPKSAVQCLRAKTSPSHPRLYRSD